MTHSTLFSMRSVTDQEIKFIHPDQSSKTTDAKYSGETLNGKPHGLGQFVTADGCKGFGLFSNGQLHGPGCLTTVNGGKGSYLYRQGIKHGFGKIYYKDESKGLVNSQTKEDVSGRASYAGELVDGWR